jgi:hypothetical protein
MRKVSQNQNGSSSRLTKLENRTGVTPLKTPHQMIQTETGRRIPRSVQKLAGDIVKAPHDSQY